LAYDSDKKLIFSESPFIKMISGDPLKIRCTGDLLNNYSLIEVNDYFNNYSPMTYSHPVSFII